MGSPWDEVSNIQFGKNDVNTMAASHILLSGEGLKRHKSFIQV